MTFKPTTTIHLLHTLLEPDSGRQLTFADADEQFTYFMSCEVRSFSDYTYQRKDNRIRVNVEVDDLYNCNYVMYQNSNYTNKWFYAYITKLEYVNETTTYIYIKTDVFQTWQFDLTYMQSFVEREHTNNDAIGANIQEEPVPEGYFKKIWNEQSIDTGVWSIVVGSTVDPTTETSLNKGTILDGRFTGVNYYAWALSQADDLYDKIYNMSMTTNVKDAITSVFMMPSSFLGESSSSGSRITSTKQGLTLFLHSKNELYMPIDGYTPRNNKLYTWQFYKLRVSNNNGKIHDYALERFNNSDDSVIFNGYCGLAPGTNIIITPAYYDISNDRNNMMESLASPNFPICEWVYNAYGEWNATQFAPAFANLFFDVPKSFLSAASSVAFGDITAPGQFILSTAQKLGNLMLQDHLAQRTPLQVFGGATNVTLTAIDNQNGDPYRGYSFEFSIVSVPYEYARIIDSYFDMFGYKVARNKIPNITGRKNWNYVKTIGCNISAPIPTDDLNEIVNMFDTGLTLWHNPDTFGDYTQPNGVI